MNTKTEQQAAPAVAVAAREPGDGAGELPAKLNPDAVTAAVKAWRESSNHPADDMVDRIDIGCAIQAYLAHCPTADTTSAQQEQDRRDAERYRWLRSIGHEQLNVMAHYAEAEMDKRIDAALTAKQDGGKA